jgi:hypothetical protein
VNNTCISVGSSHHLPSTPVASSSEGFIFTLLAANPDLSNQSALL